MDKYYIPKHLDVPVKILFFTLDEFIVSVAPCLFFIFIGFPIIAILFFSVTLMTLKKLKGEQGMATLKALLYWHLPTFTFFYVVPPSHQRFFLG